MQDFRPKHPRLRELQLALVFGWRLPGHWDVTEQQWLERSANEQLPWEIDDDQLDHFDRISNLQPRGQRPRLH
jgi:hypothetical protein